MKFTVSSDIDKIADLEETKRFVSLGLEQLGRIVNNGLGFSDNFDAKLLSVTFSAANVDVASIHGLGRVPSGYFLIGSTAAMNIYDGSTSNTGSLLYLRSSATGTARLWVY